MAEANAAMGGAHAGTVTAVNDVNMKTVGESTAFGTNILHQLAAQSAGAMMQATALGVQNMIESSNRLNGILNSNVAAHTKANAEIDPQQAEALTRLAKTDFSESLSQLQTILDLAAQATKRLERTPPVKDGE